jgi:hypothetical protein
MASVCRSTAQTISHNPRDFLVLEFDCNKASSPSKSEGPNSPLRCLVEVQCQMQMVVSWLLKDRGLGQMTSRPVDGHCFCSNYSICQRLLLVDETDPTN